MIPDLEVGQKGHVALHKAIRSRLADVREYGSIASALASGNAVIHLPAGDYQVPDGGLVVGGNGIRIVGDGEGITRIRWSRGTLFEIGGSNIRLENLSMIGDGTEAKTALRTIDITGCLFQNLEIRAGVNSIGIQTGGRDVTKFSRLYIAAGLPVLIEKNPFHYISLDTTHFEDLCLNVLDASQPCIKIASGVHLTAVTFDGVQSWMKGKYGLYWDDTESVVTSAGLRLSNVKYEQPPEGAGWIVYISHNQNMDRLTLENVSGGGGEGGINGFYLRNCRGVDIRDVSYYPREATGRVALDIDSSVHPVTIEQMYSHAGVIFNISGLTDSGALSDQTAGVFSRRLYRV